MKQQTTLRLKNIKISEGNNEIMQQEVSGR